MSALEVLPGDAAAPPKGDHGPELGRPHDASPLSRYGRLLSGRSHARRPAPQQALDDYVGGLCAAHGPLYSFARLTHYLTDAGAARAYGPALGGTYAALMAGIAKRLAELAGGPVYLADDHAYTREKLVEEFPEFRVFRIQVEDAFAESPVCPGVWVETRRFVDLRWLSRMRRELRRTGLAGGLKCAEVVAALLGLDGAAAASP